MALLEPDELARRLISARELRGMEQAEVGDLMKDEGYGKHDVAKMERCDPTAPPLNRGRRIALSEILRVPEWWFTSDEEDLFAPDGREDGVADLDRHMTALYADLMRKLDFIEEVNRDHLLPYLAEQTATPADDLRGEDTSQASSRRRRSGDPKGSLE